MPDSPAVVVAAQFAQAQAYATAATAQLSGFLAQMGNAVPKAPTISVTFAALPAPGGAPAPPRPGALDSIEDALTFDESGQIAGSTPGALTATAPAIVIDDFTEVAPVVDLGEAPVLSFGTAPVLSFGPAPTIPDVADVAVPEAPTLTMPALPTYLTLSTPTFAGVDLHEDFLEAMENDIPVLDLVAPTAYTYTPGPAYTSELLTALKTTLGARLAGGTGLSPAVEAALWQRAQDREAAAAQSEIDQVGRDSEALGYPLPAGFTIEARRRAERGYFDRISSASRDIALKQADLEQQNLKDTIASVLQLEGALIENAYKIEDLAFRSAVEVARNAIEIHNGNVTQYQALLRSFEIRAQVYDTIIKGALAQVDVFKALVAAEQSKADINRTLVEEYKAGIEGQMALVNVYRGQLEGSKLLVDIEGARVSAAGEKVRAYVASINAETSKVEAYKATVQAESAKAEAYKITVDGKRAAVDIYEVKARAFEAKARAQGDRARAQVSYYEALVRAYGAQWDGWRARVAAETERVRAVGMKSQSALDGYRADILRFDAEVRQSTELWQASVAQYKATSDYTLSASKLNSDILHANSVLASDLAKTGAQVWAQLTSGAYSMIHASAGVSASGGTSVSYSYSNDTSDTVPPITSI